MDIVFTESFGLNTDHYNSYSICSNPDNDDQCFIIIRIEPLVALNEVQKNSIIESYNSKFKCDFVEACEISGWIVFKCGPFVNDIKSQIDEIEDEKKQGKERVLTTSNYLPENGEEENDSK